MAEEKAIRLDTSQYSCKKVIFIENLFPNGGTRQFLKLLNLNTFRGNTRLFLVRRDFSSLRNILGFFKDYLYALLHKPKNVRLKIIFKPVHLRDDTVYISTSRRTLEFIKNLNSKNHYHYFQHIEFWEFLNSKTFFEYCTNKGYPDSLYFSQLFSKDINLLDKKYKNNILQINNFLTVSNFLSEILSKLNKKNIQLIDVRPHISYQNKLLNEYDLLLFYRACNFKGDEMTIEIIKKYKDKYKIVIVAFNNEIYKKIKINNNITIYIHPADTELGKIYSKSKLVINPSLSEGFGSVPQEALYHDCCVVTSNTGWVINTDSNERVVIIRKHTIDSYTDGIDKIMKLKNNYH